jgi:hypothetical protein
MSMDEAKLALLAVWNPVFKPETIAAHVESLKQAPADRKWTWWGRFYVGKRAIEEVLPTVTHGRLSRDVERVLYVTNFSSLHALRIDQIHVGVLPDEEFAQAPSYYRESQHQIPLWFRVRDVRVLHWQQLPTLTALAEMAEVELKKETGLFERSAFGKVDPYAAHKWDWPVLVDGRPVRELFPEGETFFSNPLTIAPQAILDSIEFLRLAHPELWTSLDPGAQLALASAEMVQRVTQGQQDFDVATAAIGLTRALEIELCRRLVLEGVVPALEQRVGRERLEKELFRKDDPLRWWLKRAPPTLGESIFALRNVRALSREAGWSEVTELSHDSHLGRIEGAAKLRNDVAHGAAVPREKVEQLFGELWGEQPLFERLRRALAQVA